MTDDFNLEKNATSTNTKLSTNISHSNNNSNDTANKHTCSTAKGEGCDDIIMEGINIGWIWNILNDFSNKILTFIGMNKDNSDPLTNKHTNQDQFNELKKLMIRYNKIQWHLALIIIVLIIIYIGYLLIQRDNEDQYSSIVQICYFFRELIENKDKYHNVLTFVLVISVILLVFGWWVPIIFIGLIVLGWIVFGNILFEKHNIGVFIVIILGTIIYFLVRKSCNYYRSQLNEQDENFLGKKNNSIQIQNQLLLVIIIITGIIAAYIIYKNNKKVDKQGEDNWIAWKQNYIKTNPDTTDEIINLDLKKYKEIYKTDNITTYNETTRTIIENKLLIPIHKEQEKLEGIIKKLIVERKVNNEDEYIEIYNNLIQALTERFYKKEIEIKNVAEAYGGLRTSSTKTTTSLFDTMPLLELKDGDISESMRDALIKAGIMYNGKVLNGATWRNATGEGCEQWNWDMGRIRKELMRGVGYRLLEVLIYLPGQVMITGVNFVKLIFHFLFLDSRKAYKKLVELNLFTFEYADVFSKFQNTILSHRKYAKLAPLYFEHIKPIAHKMIPHIVKKPLNI